MAWRVDVVGFYGSICTSGEKPVSCGRYHGVTDHCRLGLRLARAPEWPVSWSVDIKPTSSSSTGLSLGARTSPVIVGRRIISALLAAASSGRLPWTKSFSSWTIRAEVATRLDTIRESAALLDVGSAEGLARRYRWIQSLAPVPGF